MARPKPVDITPELIEVVAESYARGMPMEHVAGAVGVHRVTLGRWIRAGEDEIARQAEEPDTPPPDDARLNAYVALALAIKAADARFVNDNLTLIRAIAVDGRQIKTVTKTDPKTGVLFEERTETVGGNWTAAAWLLERRHNGQFGRQIRQEITGADGGPIQVDESAEARISEKLEAYYQGVVDGRTLAAERSDT